MDTPGFKTILCPVDFGELSAHALRHASLLAGCGDAKVIAGLWPESLWANCYGSIGLERNVPNHARRLFLDRQRNRRDVAVRYVGQVNFVVPQNMEHGPSSHE